MKINLFYILTGILMLLAQLLPAQPKADSKVNPKVKIYYFHPNERCPIDQSIEENTRKLVNATFSKEIREGALVFRVVNTDDPSNATLVSKFEINAQALFVVKDINGKEIHNDLTEFAFSTSLSEPVKFREELHSEVSEALKSL
jgi:hypothetical protein